MRAGVMDGAGVELTSTWVLVTLVLVWEGRTAASMGISEVGLPWVS